MKRNAGRLKRKGFRRPAFDALRLPRFVERFLHFGFHFGAQTAAKQAAEAVFGGVVHQFGRFDYIARHAVDVAVIINQAHLFGFVAGVDAAAENIGRFLLADALAAAQLHGFDEFLVDVGEHFFPNSLLLGRFGSEWVAHALVAAGGFQTALDADFVHQAGEIEAAADHAARAARLDMNADTLDTLGFVHLRAGDAQEAAAVLRKALEARPDSPSIEFRLGLALAASGDKEAAKEILKKALRTPSFPEAKAAQAELAKLEKS